MGEASLVDCTEFALSRHMQLKSRDEFGKIWTMTGQERDTGRFPPADDISHDMNYHK